ncbi:MAG: AAA family ATPase [Pseudomonadota bacterium]
MELVVFVGLQGAGKSSLYARRFADTHLRINLDMLRTRRREDAVLAACLATGQRCVIDNTNPAPADRAPYLARAAAARFTAVAYWFDVPFETCRARNAGRRGRARGADKGLAATAARLVPPNLAEGFAAVHTVDAAGAVRLVAAAEDAPAP